MCRGNRSQPRDSGAFYCCRCLPSAWSVYVCVCVLVTTVILAKTAEPTKMPFGKVAIIVVTRVRVCVQHSMMTIVITRLFTDEEAFSTLTPGRRRGNGHVKHDHQVPEVGVRVRVERDDAVDAMVVAERSVRQHGAQLDAATSTVVGRRRRQLRVGEVDVPTSPVDALDVGTLARRRERAELAVDGEHVVVRGRRPAHLPRLGPPPLLRRSFAVRLVVAVAVVLVGGTRIVTSRRRVVGDRRDATAGAPEQYDEEQ